MDISCLVIDSDSTEQKPECPAPAVMHSLQSIEDFIETPIKIQEPKHIPENQFQPSTVRKSVSFFVSLSSDAGSSSKDDAPEDISDHADVHVDEDSDSDFIVFEDSSDSSDTETEFDTSSSDEDMKTHGAGETNPAGAIDTVDAGVQNKSPATEGNSKSKKRVTFCSVPKIHIMRIYPFAMRQARLIERPERSEEDEENSIKIEGEIKLFNNKSLQDVGTH